MTEFSLQALHDEIENDPEGIGYKAGEVWKGDQAIADLINDPSNGATITRKLIARNEIIYGIEASECIQTGGDTPPAGVFSDTERWYLSILLRDETVDASDPQVFAALLAIFPTEGQRAGFRGASRTNIQTALQKQGSRAEVLWGETTIVTVSQVARSANL